MAYHSTEYAIQQGATMTYSFLPKKKEYEAGSVESKGKSGDTH